MATICPFINSYQKRTVFTALVALIAATPARARVDISAAQVADTNEIIISFDASTEVNLVRAFALDIQLNNDANILEVTGLSADYYIYPGTIQIDDFGNVIDYGTALAEYSDLPSGTLHGIDSNGVTIEMASLYAPVGPGSPNSPAKSGDLVSLKVSKDTCLTISASVPRAGSSGVVMEDPNEIVEVNLPDLFCVLVSTQTDCEPWWQDCLIGVRPWRDGEYEYWVLINKPECWCYHRQCHGDADGLLTFGRPVSLSDLNILKAGFGKTVTELFDVPDGFCADFDHKTTFGRPVSLADLNTLKQYFGVPEAQVPQDCWCGWWW
jgi:hypothetical protein